MSRPVERAAVLTALGVSVLALATAADGALEARIAISPKRPAALERTTVVVRAFAPLVREDGSCCRLEPHAPRSYPFKVEATSPTGKTSRIRVQHVRGNEWHGVVRFSTSGRWRVELPQFGRRISVQVGPPLATRAPAGFGPLGRPGCVPPSPADATQQGFRDIFGTAVGDDVLWALPFLPRDASWKRPDAAVFEGLVGKEVKIVFGMTSRREPFRAVGPRGQVLTPIWGPQPHTASSWIRQPGAEWGAGFVFPEPGCWRVDAGPRGSVWLLLRT